MLFLVRRHYSLTKMVIKMSDAQKVELENSKVENLFLKNGKQKLIYPPVEKIKTP